MQKQTNKTGKVKNCLGSFLKKKDISKGFEDLMLLKTIVEDEGYENGRDTLQAY